ncbi:MAG: Rab family GTPase [Candidatus Kariarchaeaceae archaeon]
MSNNYKLDFDHAFKILILGDPGVGKSSLVRRFVHGKFQAQYLMTIGMEPYSKYETINDVKVCYAIWDIAGADSFKIMHRIYFQGAVGSVVVFDLTRRESFDKVDDWIQNARNSAPNQLIILFGNKNDLEDRQVTNEEAFEKAKKLNCINYFETSALTGENVDPAFNNLGSKLLDRYTD